MEIESVSSCEEDLDTCPAREPPLLSVEPAAQAVGNNDNARLSDETGGGTATVTAAGSATSTRHTESPTAPPGGDARQTVETLPGATESPVQLIAREGTGVASSPTQRRQTVAGPLIEEPPPHYSSLFPAPVTTSSSATNNRQPQSRVGGHRPSESIQHPPFTQRCSVCDTTQPPLSHNSSPYLYHHHNLHHTGHALPGMIGQHYPEHYLPRDQAQYHRTIVSMPGAQPRNVPDDYMKLSFVCVLLCTLQLNFPALLCVLPALAYSIRTQKLNTEGRHELAVGYSRSALTCNLLAFCQYVVFVVAVATVALYYILLNDYL